MGDTSRGLYSKYHVSRTDGSSGPGAKHDCCNYFVLDMTHDPHGVPAILAYADSCAEGHPLLAADLRALYGPPEQAEDDTPDARFRAAFDALTTLYSDDRLEEYFAGGIEDMTVSLAADFGYTVDHLGRLVETPDCNEQATGDSDG